MTQGQYKRLEELFDVAIKLRATERAQFFEQECRGDDQLRVEIEALVAAYLSTTNALLDTPEPLNPMNMSGETGVADFQSTEPASLAAGTLPVPGERVGCFLIRRKLGRGGMGVVYLARDTRLNRHVAIKFLLDAESELGRRFLIEARALARCKHENIVGIHDIAHYRGYPYMVLEYWEGETLQQWLKRRTLPLPPNQAAEIMIPVVRALESAHGEGVIHRDLKPENILVTESGRIKVLDFGLAKLFFASRQPSWTEQAPSHDFASTNTGIIMGTVPYMSPEQWGAGDADHRTDIWAVGIMLFLLAVGRHPLEPLSPARLLEVGDLAKPMPRAQDVAPDLGVLAAIIDNCLLKRKEARIGSAAELLARLEQVPKPRGSWAAPALPANLPGLGGGASTVRIRPEKAKPGSPDLIDFTGERGRHKHFFGRQDILRELDEWMGVRESGWVLMTGSPGLGKSAIFNHWLGQREQSGLPVAFHFIRRGIQNWADPAVVCASLAAQIERDFPEQRDTGVAPELRLEQLLHRVSTVLEQRGHTLVLLVDGLDEAMTLGGSDNPLPRMFPHELPGRVFVFAASRPLYPHLDWFTRRSGAVRMIDLDRLDWRPNNLDTVRAYWTEMSATLSPPPATELVQAAIERSQGNMLHAVKLYLRWSEPGAQRSIEDIPQGFKGMLNDLWERLGTLPKEQKRLARQGVSLLCAARQALPLAVIDQLLGWDEGEARDALLPLVREFLHEEHWHAQPAYRPFHQGVRELVERELPETLREHHRRLAQFAAWPLAGNEFRRSYALQHRVVHQVEGELLKEAAASCHNVEYLTEKACALGVVEVEREIRRCARVQEPAVRKQLETLALVVGACSHRASEVPRALPALLHDRLLSFAPALRGALVWPARLRQCSPVLRHPLQKGGLARVLAGHRDGVSTVAVLSDGRIVSGSHDGTLRVWDVNTGETCATLAGHQDWVLAVAVLSDERVVSSSADGTLRVWDVSTGQAIATLADQPGRGSAAPTLLDEPGAASSQDGATRDLTASTGQILAALADHQVLASTVAALPDDRVVSGYEDGTLRVWDATTGQTLATLVGHQGPVRAVAALPDGRVVSGSRDGTLRIWDVTTWQSPPTLAGRQGPVRAMAVLPDGRVVSGFRDGTLRVWDVTTGQTLATLEGHQQPVWTVAVLPGGRIVSGSQDGTLRVWDATTGQTLVTLKDHQGCWVLAVAMLPDGRVVSGAQDGSLRVWDVAGGQTLATLEGHSGPVRTVAVLPDGRFVSGSEDGLLRIWDVAGGQTLATLAGHRGWVNTVAALPDGRVVSGSDDGSVRVWDVDNGQTLVTFAGHQRPVMAVAALPDGRVVSGSDDGTLQVWDVTTGQSRATVYGDASFCSVAAVSRELIAAGDGVGNVWFVELP